MSCLVELFPTNTNGCRNHLKDSEAKGKKEKKKQQKKRLSDNSRMQGYVSCRYTGSGGRSG